MICIMRVGFVSSIFSLRVVADLIENAGEGHFDDGSNKPSGAATPIDGGDLGQGAALGKRGVPGKPKGISKKAKTAKQKLEIADGTFGSGSY